MNAPLLSIRNLSVRIGAQPAAPAILDNVSLDIAAGETLGIVGESGSGKSTLGTAALRLNAPALEAGTSGEIFWKGQDILKLSKRELRQIRGKEISMILQDPMSSLNPVQSIGAQVKEALAQVHSTNLESAAVEALAEVNIPSPAERLKAYPHHMSGGMRQRIVSAIGLAQGPKLLICDEPTTALDATIQFQFLELLKKLHQSHDMAMMFITHDFGVVARICDRVAVMYAGQIVESGPIEQIFTAPTHPYTRALLQSVPSIDETPDRLPVINGHPPSVIDRPAGCAFHTRCAFAQADCQKMPAQSSVGDAHHVRCWHPLGEPA